MPADSRLAPLDRDHPENLGILAYLARGESRSRVPIARPSSLADPYQGAGSHPDVVERVWDDLGKELPRACRALVFGTPALVHERAGLVLAVALGTQYGLRLPAARLAQAEEVGLEIRHTYRTSGDVLDLSEFGTGWRFGSWHGSERDWLRELHLELAAR
jgi:hypothetical protein